MRKRRVGRLTIAGICVDVYLTPAVTMGDNMAHYDLVTANICISDEICPKYLVSAFWHEFFHAFLHIARPGQDEEDVCNAFGASMAENLGAAAKMLGKLADLLGSKETSE